MQNTFGTFAITGPQGAGKSLMATFVARSYLLANKPLVSNLDFYLDKMLPYFSKATYVRISDYPDFESIWKLGDVSQSADESKFGALILDELAVIANSRDWSKANRSDMVAMLRQARKHGYNSYYISQDVESIDAQIRKSLIEHVVYCKRTDRIKLPFVFFLILFVVTFIALYYFYTFLVACFSVLILVLPSLFSKYLKFPRIHIGVVRLGLNKTDMKVDTWQLRGDDLFAAYNTKQKFYELGHSVTMPIKYRYTKTPLGLIPVEGDFSVTDNWVDAPYSVLSAWHLRGRYLSSADLRKMTLRSVLPKVVFITAAVCFLQFAYNLFIYQSAKSVPAQAVDAAPQSSQSATFTSIKGVFYNGYYYVLKLDDGSTILTDKTHLIGGQRVFEKEGLLYGFKN